LTSLLADVAASELNNVKIVGLMGMATFTDSEEQIEREFTFLKNTFEELKAKNPQLQILSMGMSGDYKLGIKHGSNMIRIGSAIFGERN
jgi:hypothetical protein